MLDIGTENIFIDIFIFATGLSCSVCDWNVDRSRDHDLQEYFLKDVFLHVFVNERGWMLFPLFTAFDLYGHLETPLTLEQI